MVTGTKLSQIVDGGTYDPSTDKAVVVRNGALDRLVEVDMGAIGGLVPGGRAHANLYVNPDGILAQADAPTGNVASWDYDTNIGIDVTDPFPAVANSFYTSLLIAPTITQNTDAANLAYPVGSAVDFTVNGTGDISGVLANYFQATYSGSGTLADGIYGLQGQANVNGASAVVPNACSVISFSSVSAGDISDLIGFWAYHNDVLGGTVVNNYGIKVDPQSGATNNWNSYIGNPASDFNPVNTDLSVLDAQNVFASVNPASGTGTVLAALVSTDNADLSFGTTLYAHGTATNIATGLFGVQFLGEWAGSGTAAEISGGLFFAGHAGTGTITDLVSAHVYTNNSYGGGTVTNSYGIKLDDQNAGTNNWNIHSGNTADDTAGYGPFAKNFFLTKNYSTGDVNEYRQTGTFINYHTSGTTGSAAGLVGLVDISGTANVDFAIVGVEADVFYRGAGTQPQAWGFTGFVSSDSGTVTNGIAVYAQGVFANGSGVITNAFGTYIDSNATGAYSPGGTITNNYGLFVADQTAGSSANFAISTGLGRHEFGGCIELPYIAKGTSYTLTADDYTVNATTAAITLTLPTAVGIPNRIYVIKNASNGTITLNTTSAQTIFAASAVTSITVNVGESYTVQSTGANWIVI